ncbi:alanine dehydrogenase [Thiohalobacter sp.]|uniref:alanine dehydrogenase n=1 Tax=Thiohalobacter sp. TaxID=2025948 RepID=UPI002605B8FE|nr:alanine dehydrogenase [Thiohalobacter sp.]
MRIGVPREIKTLEYRVGLVPDACADLIADGHEVWLEQGAGEGSGYPDAAYAEVGARIAPDAAALYAAAELIVKVKEPVAGDLAHLRSDHILFCYLHLAANPELARELARIGLTAIAFETVTDESGGLPLLAPMSDVAGRLSIQIGANLLQRPHAGKGLLLGGLPAAERGRVTVIGAGNAGGNAAAMAAAMGAEVTVFDRRRDRLERMRALGPNVTALYPYRDALIRAVAQADLLVGAVLIPGARAPHLVGRADIESMAPGSVVVDISVDQGGCIETTRPTTYADPTYVEAGVVHFAVTNMPGAVPRSASQALSAALIPHARALAADPAVIDRPGPLAAGVNVRGGAIVHPAVRAAVGES